jgi:hypothetical protein
MAKHRRDLHIIRGPEFSIAYCNYYAIPTNMWEFIARHTRRGDCLAISGCAEGAS